MITKRKVKEKPGVWFINREGSKLPGILRINPNDYTQFLTLYTETNFEGSSIKVDDSIFGDIELIFGETSGGIPYTLKDCRFRKSSPIGENLYEITYIPEITFYGGFLKKNEETKIFQLSCSFPLLSSWYDTNRNYFGSFSPSSDLDKMKPAISGEELTDEIVIDNDLTVAIERNYSQNAWVMSKEVSASIHHCISFTTKSPRSYYEFRKLAYRFLQLIQLSTGKLIYLEFNHVLADENDIDSPESHLTTKDGHIYLPITFYSYDRKRDLIKSDYIHQNNMLFYGGVNKKDSLNDIIRSWFNNYDKYESIYNRYLDTFEWFQNTDAVMSELMFHNRFVNLIQAIENYHFISHPEFNKEKFGQEKEKLQTLLEFIPDKEDKDWILERISSHTTLGQRMQDIMTNKLSFITSEIFKNRNSRDSFIHKTKRIRDDLSHGNKLTYQTEITEYYEKALIMLASCVLLTIGLDNEQIKKTLFRTGRYSRMISFFKSKF